MCAAKADHRCISAKAEKHDAYGTSARLPSVTPLYLFCIDLLDLLDLPDLLTSLTRFMAKYYISRKEKKEWSRPSKKVDDELNPYMLGKEPTSVWLVCSFLVSCVTVHGPLVMGNGRMLGHAGYRERAEVHEPISP